MKRPPARLCHPPAPETDWPPPAAADHDDQVRRQFARELAVMLDELGQDYAADLVRGAPTDGLWP